MTSMHCCNCGEDRTSPREIRPGQKSKPHLRGWITPKKNLGAAGGESDAQVTIAGKYG